MPALSPGSVVMPKPDDPALLQRIVEATLLGHALKTAAPLVNIDPATAYRWYNEGTADIEAQVLSPHATFTTAVNLARAQKVASRLTRIEEAGSGAKTGKPQWQADAWVLERTESDDFALTQRHEVSGSVQIDARVVVTELPTEVRALILRAGAEALEAEHKLLPPGGTETAEPEDAERAEP